MTSIELTFLGTGSAIPTLKRGHTSLHISYNGKERKSILFDCGEGAQLNMLKAGLNFMAVDMIFITHWHADHFIGLYGLLNSMGLENRERPIKIFGPKAHEIGPELLKFYRFPFVADFFDSGAEGVIYEEEEFRVESLKTKHTIESVAYAFIEKPRLRLDKKLVKELGLSGMECRELKEKGEIEKGGQKIPLIELLTSTPERKLVYSGDTVFLEEMKEFASGAEILIHECTCHEREDLGEKQHTCLEDIAKLNTLAKKTYLVHIGRKYQHKGGLEETVRHLKNVRIAKELEKVRLG
jgi:ribonuclease Z